MLSEQYQNAVIYSMNLHKSQVRKGSGIPYITHLFSVSVTVLEYGGNEQEAIAALLHDAVEDQGGLKTLQDIESKFGSEIASIVEECSDSIIEDPSHKTDWKTRKLEYLKQLPHKSKSAILVTLADKLHNANSMIRDIKMNGEEVYERFEGKKDGTIWYYKEMLSIFEGIGSVNLPLLEELKKAIRMLSDENNY